MAQSVTVELELRIPAQKFWEAIQDSATVFPKIMPSQFKSIEMIEGDGKSVGSTRHIKYGEGMKQPDFRGKKKSVCPPLIEVSNLE